MSESSNTHMNAPKGSKPVLVQCIVTQQGVDVFEERSVFIAGNRFRVNMQSINADKKALAEGVTTVGEYPFTVHDRTKHLALVTPRGYKESMDSYEVIVPRRYVFAENQKEPAWMARPEDIESELVNGFVEAIKKHKAVEKKGFGIPGEIPPATFITHKVSTDETGNSNREQVIRLALIAGDDPSEYLEDVGGKPAEQTEVEEVKNNLFHGFITQIDPIASSMFETVEGDGGDRLVVDLSKV